MSHRALVVSRIVLGGSLLVALAGCRGGPGAELQRRLERLDPGTTMAEARTQLGPPSHTYRGFLHAGFYGLPPALWDALGPSGKFEVWTYVPCPAGSPDAADEGDVEYHVYFGGAPGDPPPAWHVVTYDGKNCANPAIY